MGKATAKALQLSPWAGSPLILIWIFRLHWRDATWWIYGWWMQEGLSPVWSGHSLSHNPQEQKILWWSWAARLNTKDWRCHQLWISYDTVSQQVRQMIKCYFYSPWNFKFWQLKADSWVVIYEVISPAESTVKKMTWRWTYGFRLTWRITQWTKVSPLLSPLSRSPALQVETSSTDSAGNVFFSIPI